MLRCIKCDKPLVGRQRKYCSERCKRIIFAKLRRVRLKAKAIIYKGGECERCGYKKCTAVLEFHHVDGDGKEFQMSDMHCKPWSVVQEELDKCVLLCANCHREEHFPQSL